MQNLTARELERLVKLCGLFSSLYPEEIASAAAKADAFLRERGLTWTDVLRLPVTVPVVPQTNGGDLDSDGLFDMWSDDWRGAVAFVLRHRVKLSKWDREFCEKIVDWRGNITAKQRPILAAIVDKVRDAGHRP